MKLIPMVLLFAAEQFWNRAWEFACESWAYPPGGALSYLTFRDLCRRREFWIYFEHFRTQAVS